MGGSSARAFNTAFADTGAARPETGPELDSNGSDMENGEGYDRATLNLAGVQQKLLQQIVATGKPVVLVLVEGRPLEMGWAAANVPAILNAWYPGEAGGLAIADALFGDFNPAGRLPISIPRSVGQLPVNYGQFRADYVDMPSAPQFAFGYGLSYTTFDYANLRHTVHFAAGHLSVKVSVEVTNTGKRDGDEVAQLYLHPLASSVETPAKALRGFARVHLGAGQTQTVEFSLLAEDLAVFNQKGKWVVEPGTFEVMVGGSSDRLRQTTQFTVTQSENLP
jgi:beta-glucosidase